MELVVLSSPPRPVISRVCTTPPCNQQRVFTSSSSPGLPSPSAFFSGKTSGALRSGSRAAQVPEGAITGFATASSLILSRQLSFSAEEFPTEQSARQQRVSLAEVDASTRARPKKLSKRSVIKAPKLDEDPRSKVPRKKDMGTLDSGRSNIDTSDCPLVAIELTEAQCLVPDSIEQIDMSTRKSAPSKSRKPKQPKAGSETQSKLKKGKITKPGRRDIASKSIGLDLDDTIGAESTDVVSEHFLRRVSPGVTRNNDNQTSKTTCPMVNDPRKGHVTDSINSTHCRYSNLSEETLKEEEPISTIEEARPSEGALKRRTNWTPVKDTKSIQIRDAESAKQGAQSLSPSSTKDSFSADLVAYTYSESMEPRSAAVSIKHASGPALAKRRRIEIIDLSTNQSTITTVTDHIQKEKAKIPKKKARTITDLVTAQYVRREVEPPVPAITSSLFTIGVESEYSNTVSTLESGSMSVKPARRSATERRSCRGDTRKGKAPPKSKTRLRLAAVKLLSPESAVRKMNKQDILFGTSSQLAREESPSFIRETQQAIRESESEFVGENSNKIDDLHHDTRLSLIKTNRGLWAAAARDFGNNLLTVEESPCKIPTSSKYEINGVSQQKCESGTVNSGQLCEELSPTSETSKTGISDAELSRNSAVPLKAGIVPTLETFADINEFENITPRTSAEHSSFLDIEDFRQHRVSISHSQNRMTTTSVSTSKKTVIPPAQTNGPASLGIAMSLPKKGGACNKSVNSIPEAAIRGDFSKRSTMDIQHTLSKKPRDGPRKSVLAGSPSSLPENLKGIEKCLGPSQSSGAAPTTPKKNIAQLQFTHIDEISDSESGLTPTPPRVSVCCTASPPLELSSRESRSRVKPLDTATSLAWATTRLTLFPQITAVVKNTLRSVNPGDLSWYEKILMYDPIVLEDFTAWLNTQGLRVPGKASAVKARRKEMGTKIVKESKDKVVDIAQVIQKELEAWMVQKWCEEKSVCCLWREGLRGGVKNKY